MQGKFSMRKLLLFIPIIATISFTACKKEYHSPEVVPTEDTYYPLVIGKYNTFRTDSLIYDDFNRVEISKTLYLKYTIEDTFRDNQGRLSYYISIQKRDKLGQPWEANDVIYATKTSKGLEVQERNLRFIKLIDDVEENKTWKGNSYINALDQDYQHLLNWDYKFTKVGMQDKIDDKVYDNTVLVIERDEQINDPDTQPKDYAERTFSAVTYAKGVGMIRKEFVRWVYQVNPNSPNLAYRKGAKVVMTAIDHN